MAKVDPAPSLRQLAKALGKSHTAIQNAAKHEDWPWQSGPYPVDEARQWMWNNLDQQDRAPEQQGGRDPDELVNMSHEKRAKLALVIERAAKIKVEREMLLGGYLKKEDVQRDRLARIAAVKAELMNIRLVALKLEGIDLLGRERLLEDWARGVCGRFENGE